MIPVADPTGAKTSRSMIVWCVVLVAASLIPIALRPVDWMYLVGAVLLGALFLRSTLQFRADRTEWQARKVLRASILYLPGIMALVLVHAFLTGCTPAPTTSASTGNRPDLDIPAPAFTMTERSGNPVTRDDLKGKVWVASFVFTRCSGPCPQVSATMARLQKELKLSENPNLRLVTFTVDPDRDTPNELKEYANRYQADPEKWLFLTGLPEAELHKLLKDGFKVTAQRSTSQEAGDEFDHSSRLAVVDKHGTIRGYFDGIPSKSSPDADTEFEENLKRLREKVGQLLSE